MNIDEVARATSSYFITRVDFDDFFVGTKDAHAGSFRTYAEAQAACGRLNLLAVLEAIRGFGGPFAPDYEMVIDAIIAEVGK